MLRLSTAGRLAGVILIAATLSCGDETPAAPVNVDPVTGNASVTTFKNVAVVATLPATDADGDALSFTVTAPPQHGAVRIALADGETMATYTPDAGYAGADGFAFDVSDGKSIASGSVAIEVLDPAPVLRAVENVVRAASGAVDIRVAAIDPAGDALVFDVVNAPQHGRLQQAGTVPAGDSITAQFSYVPDEGSLEADAFTIVASDGRSRSDPATVRIRVNAPPHSVGRSITTGMDVPVAIDLEGTDNDGDALSFGILEQPQQGTLSAVQSVGANGARVTFTPAPGFAGTASFTYVVRDALDVSAPATVEVAVMNAAPVADAQTVAAVEDTPIGITLTGADAESGGLTFAIVASPANGMLSVITNATTTYSPAADFNGTDSFSFTATDASGLADTATVSIGVAAVNDGPSFATGADVKVPEGLDDYAEPWAASVSAGPADESSQTLYFEITNNTDPELFAVAPAISPAGELTFTLNPEPIGSGELTIVLLDDGGTDNGGVSASAPATLTISIGDRNDPPTFVAGPDQTVLEDAGPETVAEWIVSVSPGPHDERSQTVTYTVTDYTNRDMFAAAPAVATDGTLSYTLAPDESGTSVVTLMAQDNGGTAFGALNTSAPQTFEITVEPVNDAPAFTPGGDVRVFEKTGDYAAGWATGISAGPQDEQTQTLNFEIVQFTDPELFDVAPEISPAGELTFVVDPDVIGRAVVTVRLHDDGGTADGGVDQTEEASFSIFVEGGVNDAPSFDAGSDQTVAEDAGAQSVAAWATDVSAGPPDEAGQSVTFAITGNTNPALFAVTPAVAADGTLTYTPAADANGSATITLTVADDGGTFNNGTDASAPQSFSIAVGPVNDAPGFTAGADPDVAEDAGAQTIGGWATDITAGPANESSQGVTFSITAISDSALFAGLPAVAADGTLTFTPAADANGSATLTLVAADDGGTADGGVDTSAPRTVTIDVAAVNDAPEFTGGSDIIVAEDAGAQTVADWATAISAGPANEVSQSVSFDVTAISDSTLFDVLPAVADDGTLTFTPATDANGSGTIIVVAQDDGGTADGGTDTSAPDTFTITITAVNDAPRMIASPLEAFATAGNTTLQLADSQTVEPSVFVTGNLASNFTDPDGDAVEIVRIENVSDGATATLSDATGTFLYFPPAGRRTDATFDYVASDGVEEVTRTVTVSFDGMIWYVDDNSGTSAGTSTNPFATLAEVSVADMEGDWIFVYDGEYDEDVELLENQKLIGERAGLTADVDGSLVTLVEGDPLQDLSILAGRLDLATGVTVKSIRFDEPLGYGIKGVDVSDVTLDGIDIEFSTGDGILLNGPIGTINITDLEILEPDDAAIHIIGGDATIDIELGIGDPAPTGAGIDANGGELLRVEGTGTGAITISGNAMEQFLGDGIIVSDNSYDIDIQSEVVMRKVDNVAARFSNFDGAATMDRLDIRESFSSEPSFIVEGTGDPEIVIGGGVWDLVNGTAFTKSRILSSEADITLDTLIIEDGEFESENARLEVGYMNVEQLNMDGGELVVTDPTSQIATVIDVTLDQIDAEFADAGQFLKVDAASGSLTVADGQVRQVELGGGADLFLGADVIRQSGVSEITIENRTGGTAEFTGNILLADLANSGITLRNNTAGSVIFSGASKQVESSRFSSIVGAVTMTGNSAPFEVVFENGGLAITSSADAPASGNVGLRASGSGSLEITGPDNTIEFVGNGAAIAIEGVQVGAGGIEFAEVSTGGRRTVYADAEAHRRNYGVYLAETGSNPITLGTLDLQFSDESAVHVEGAVNLSVTGATTVTDPANSNQASIYLTDTTEPISFSSVEIQNRQNSGIEIDDASGIVEFGTVTIFNPNTVEFPAIELFRGDNVILDGDHEIDQGGALAAGIKAQQSTLRITGGVLSGAGRNQIETGGRLALTGVVIRDVGRHGISSTSGQIDLVDVDFRNLDQLAVDMSANLSEHRLRIRDSSIDSVATALAGGYAISANVVWASVVLENLTIGSTRKDGTFRAFSAADNTGDICVSLEDISFGGGPEPEEILIDGSGAEAIRLEEPITGVDPAAVVKVGSVTSVAPGTCPLPSF